MKRSVALMAITAAAAIALDAVSDPGDLIQNVPLPVEGVGVSVAVDCDGNVFYTLENDTNLYQMDSAGNLLGMLPILDGNDPLLIDEMAFENSGGAGTLWGQLHDSNPVEVYTIDPATGAATFAFTSQTISVGSFRDGIAFDGSDSTLWISGDVSDTIEHYMLDGTYINTITPKDAAGNTLGTISGVTVGVGDLLYLGRNGLVEIVQVKKSNGDFIASFASPGGARDEGLECDAVNFAPLLALWSREFNEPGFMSVIEIEPETCQCGGGGVEVPVDIKPGSCPNSFNRKNRGVLPISVLGTMDFDVMMIDLPTVRLSRADGVGGSVAPRPRSVYDDTGTPFEGELCDCHELYGDGITDLSMKFYSQMVVSALELNDLMGGDMVELVVSGMLLDGTAFNGADCIRLVPPHAGPGARSSGNSMR